MAVPLPSKPPVSLPRRAAAGSSTSRSGPAAVYERGGPAGGARQLAVTCRARAGVPAPMPQPSCPMRATDGPDPPGRHALSPKGLCAQQLSSNVSFGAQHGPCRKASHGHGGASGASSRERWTPPSRLLCHGPWPPSSLGAVNVGRRTAPLHCSTGRLFL